MTLSFSLKRHPLEVIPTPYQGKVARSSTRLFTLAGLGCLRNGPCLACVYRVMDAYKKLGEHEGSV